MFLNWVREKKLKHTLLTLVLVGVWLLQVASVLVHSWGALTVLHGLLVSSGTWFHTNLRWDHVLRSTLHILPWLVALGELWVVNSLLVSKFRSLATTHHWHVCHSGCDLTHLGHGSYLIASTCSLVQRVLVLIGTHRGARLWRLTSTSTIIFSVEVLVLVSLSCCSTLSLTLAVLLNDLFDHRFAQIVKPGLCKGVDSRVAVLRV